jgi:hypothetical protein
MRLTGQITLRRRISLERARLHVLDASNRVLYPRSMTTNYWPFHMRHSGAQGARRARNMRMPCMRLAIYAAEMLFLPSLCSLQFPRTRLPAHTDHDPCSSGSPTAHE